MSRRTFTRAHSQSHTHCRIPEEVTGFSGGLHLRLLDLRLCLLSLLRLRLCLHYLQDLLLQLLGQIRLARLGPLKSLLEDVKLVLQTQFLSPVHTVQLRFLGHLPLKQQQQLLQLLCQIRLARLGPLRVSLMTPSWCSSSDCSIVCWTCSAAIGASSLSCSSLQHVNSCVSSAPIALVRGL